MSLDKPAHSVSYLARASASRINGSNAVFIVGARRRPVCMTSLAMYNKSSLLLGGAAQQSQYTHTYTNTLCECKSKNKRAIENTNVARLAPQKYAFERAYDSSDNEYHCYDFYQKFASTIFFFFSKHQKYLSTKTFHCSSKHRTHTVINPLQTRATLGKANLLDDSQSMPHTYTHT